MHVIKISSKLRTQQSRQSEKYKFVKHRSEEKSWSSLQAVALCFKNTIQVFCFTRYQKFYYYIFVTIVPSTKYINMQEKLDKSYTRLKTYKILQIIWRRWCSTFDVREESAVLTVVDPITWVLQYLITDSARLLKSTVNFW